MQDDALPSILYKPILEIAMFKTSLASLLMIGALPVIASGQTFVDDLTGFGNNVSVFTSGVTKGRCSRPLLQAPFL